MIAGGTGIAPMLQIITTVLSDPMDTTNIFLLFTNKSRRDILFKERLDDLRKQHIRQFKLHYVIDDLDGKGDWKYSSGFINEEIIRSHLAQAGDDTVVLLCGPRPMIEFSCRPNLTRAGHSDKNVIEL